MTHINEIPPIWQFASVTPNPAPGEVGTLNEQLGAIELFLSDPDTNRSEAWQRARQLVISHERRHFYLNWLAANLEGDNESPRTS